MQAHNKHGFVWKSFTPSINCHFIIQSIVAVIQSFKKKIYFLLAPGNHMWSKLDYLVSLAAEQTKM
jgi:hypothetical protein